MKKILKILLIILLIITSFDLIIGFCNKIRYSNTEWKEITDNTFDEDDSICYMPGDLIIRKFTVHYVPNTCNDEDSYEYFNDSFNDSDAVYTFFGNRLITYAFSTNKFRITKIKRISKNKIKVNFYKKNYTEFEKIEYKD